jgi:putative DNA primase/helicase
MDGYFGPNEQEEARFLMRWLGSALYPANLSRTLMFWLGAEGSNGKSSLAKAIAATLGLQQGYAGIAANGLLSKAHFQRSGSEHSAHLSSIPSGCRFLYVDEMGELSWDQELVKKLASVEPMYIRGAYAHHHRLAIPRFNLVVSSNHMPPLENCEPAMLARLVILKFDKTFQKNPEVDALMQSPEFLEGLLDDMLEGLRDYHAGGGSLEPPASCILAGAELVEDIDRIGRFLEECTTTGFVDLEVPTRNQVYLAYKQWCWDMSADRAPESSTRFYADLKRKGYQPDYRGGTNRYIKLRDRELRLLPRDESRSC